MTKPRLVSLLRLAALVSLLALPSQGALAAPVGGANDPPAFAAVRALILEKQSRSPAQRRMDSRLLRAHQRRVGRRSALAALPAPKLREDPSGRVLVDITAKVSSGLLSDITDLGGEIVNQFAKYDAVRAWVPLAAVEAVAALAGLQHVRPPDEMETRKINTSTGDIAHRANLARANLGIAGAGIKIGVISDSVDNLATVQSSGDLPAVTVLSGQSGTPASGEGTAMLEIVYDLAPSAQLYFATAYGGQAQFATNIQALRNAGCHVIVDDVAYFAEPVFQDGIIAQAVTNVVNSGALYFSSAGNDGNANDGTSGTWEGDFVDSGQNYMSGMTNLGDIHSFGASTTNTILGDTSSVITLQWSDAGGASANDYDLYLLSSDLSTLIDASDAAQDGNDTPYEAIDSSSRNDVGNKLMIVRYSGSARFLHLATNRGRLSIPTAGAVWGHSAAAEAIAVAAVSAAGMSSPFTGSKVVETFSSDGPRRVFYQANGTALTPGNFLASGGALRDKPEISGADGVACAASGFNPFYGTSAAAPHTAAIAALVWSTNLALTPTQVRNAMTSTAIDIEAAGTDRDSGVGIIDALAAAQAVGGPTFTPTRTTTRTPTRTATRTATHTPTRTPTSTPTHSPSPTLTRTATHTPTSTQTASTTPTSTTTSTPTATPTSTATATPTPTDTASHTPTDTASATPTSTATETLTLGPSLTPTETPTATSSPTATSTPTLTQTSTRTASTTPTATATESPTSTLSPSATNTPTSTPTPTQTATATDTATSTATSTPEPFCVGGVLITGAKIKISKVPPPAGDEKLAISGQVDLAIDTPEIDLIANGVELAEFDAAGQLVFVRTVPAGAAASSQEAGWTANSRGTAWTFKDRAGTTAGGITKIAVKRLLSRGPNVYSFKIRAKVGNFGLDNVGQVPIRLHVALGGRQHFESGQCGAIEFNGPGQAPPACTVLGSGSLICK